MAAVRSQFADMMGRCANQPLNREELRRCDQLVMTSRKEKKRCFDLFEINGLSQRFKCPGGDLVALVKFLHGLEKVRSRQIDGPRIPIAERGFETSKGRGTVGFLAF